MGQHLSTYNGAFARAFSGAIWNNAPLTEVLTDPSAGLLVFDDFKQLATGVHTVTNATAGTFTLQNLRHGIARADAASTTATQGVNVQRVGAVFQPAANSKIYFEARVRFNEAPATSPPDFFLGLSEVDTTLIASGANSSANHIGFELINEDATLDFVNEKAGTRTTNSDVTTLVEDTWINLGFEVIGTEKILVYVNGVLVATVTANIPEVVMTMSLVCQASATAAAQPEVDIDWWACLQTDRS